MLGLKVRNRAQEGPGELSSSDETTYASPPASTPYHLTDAHEVVNVDAERALVVIRASGGSTDLSMGGGHFSASLAVDAFEIEDLLVGPRCPGHAYLARSFLATREPKFFSLPISPGSAHGLLFLESCQLVSKTAAGAHVESLAADAHHVLSEWLTCYRHWWSS